MYIYIYTYIYIYISLSLSFCVSLSLSLLIYPHISPTYHPSNPNIKPACTDAQRGSWGPYNPSSPGPAPLPTLKPIALHNPRINPTESQYNPCVLTLVYPPRSPQQGCLGAASSTRSCAGGSAQAAMAVGRRPARPTFWDAKA